MPNHTACRREMLWILHLCYNGEEMNQGFYARAGVISV